MCGKNEDGIITEYKSPGSSKDVLIYKYTRFTTDMSGMHFSINSPHCPISDDREEDVKVGLQGINRFVYILFGNMTMTMTMTMK